MDQRRKSFNTVNSGPNKNRVQIPGKESRFREAQHSLDAIKKNLQKAWKNKEFTKEDMEKAEADWKFEAMCSGEAYYEYGKWKWRY